MCLDVNDLFNDAISFYKNSEFNPEQPIRVTFDEQPAIDGGGVLRQFYTDLFSIFVDEKMMFVGEYNRLVPSRYLNFNFIGTNRYISIYIEISTKGGRAQGEKGRRGKK
jgi:hypothetical protein